MHTSPEADMKKSVCPFILIVSISVLSSLPGTQGDSQSLGSPEWRANPENQIRKKSIRGRIINSNLLGMRWNEDLGTVKFRRPNVLTLRIIDVSIADGAAPVVKTFTFKNIARLPFTYDLDVSDVIFVRGLTYSLSAHLDSDMSGSITKGDYFNSVRHGIRYNHGSSDVINMNLYIGKYD